ncbi:flagellar hook protein [Nocardioides houyundeii]|uniref:flagellin N-terminal helical domain-containing protein n=1 Tax=Nocardioides houyundeii TaxID=2045452 RepID=UPI000DF4560A|nr:flagellar hook protein [Nocardioides houyundeii]
MTTMRVTQNMMAQRSLEGMYSGLGRLSKLQEQVSSGKVLSRPSDSPADTTAAMRLRASLVEVGQQNRNIEDGQAWLARVDDTLQSAVLQTRHARELGLQGANTGSMSPSARDALATEIESLRESLLSVANTTHLDRPVFGGLTPGKTAYDTSGGFVGIPGEVTRSVADGVKVRVDADARAVFGPDGANLFDNLQAMADAVRSGDAGAVRSGLDALDGNLDRLGVSLIDVGARTSALDRAAVSAADRELSLKSSLSGIEDVDLPKALMDLKMAETSYQAALASTARVMAPSLLDFLR